MKNVVRVENGSMIFGQGGSGGSDGHVIQNDSGTALPQESALQFVGVYSEDDSTNGKTKVNIIREMTKAQMDALSTDAKKGVIHTTDEPDNPANPISAEGVANNGIYRGKYLGNSVTAEQWSQISSGKFDDLYIGDYWTINDVNWRIAHFDYWLHSDDVECTTHHVLIVPDGSLYSAQMNTTNTSTGGYYNSAMRGGANYPSGGNLASAVTIATSAFGASHLLSHKELLTNTINGDNASNWAWYDSSVELMSEVQVYGCPAWSVGGKGYEVGIDKEQLALFRLDHSKITNRSDWWLRSVASSMHFCLVGDYGYVYYGGASTSYGVRPVFAII